MSIQNEVELLRRIPLFAQIETSRLKLLAFTSERLAFDAGAVLFSEGDRGDSAYLILKGGKVDVSVAFAERPRGRGPSGAIAPLSAKWRSSATCRAPRPITATEPLDTLKIKKDLVLPNAARPAANDARTHARTWPCACTTPTRNSRRRTPSCATRASNDMAARPHQARKIPAEHPSDPEAPRTRRRRCWAKISSKSTPRRAGCASPTTRPIKLANRYGAIHGGMTAAMMDDVISLAAGLTIEWGQITPTLEMKVSYIAQSQTRHPPPRRSPHSPPRRHGDLSRSRLERRRRQTHRHRLIDGDDRSDEAMTRSQAHNRKTHTKQRRHEEFGKRHTRSARSTIPFERAPAAQEKSHFVSSLLRVSPSSFAA